MNELLRVHRLYAGYGTGDIIHDISFSLPAGQICAVLGNNGAGKSTLLRAVCGLLCIRGNARIFDAEICHMGARERAGRISYLAARSGSGLDVTCEEAVLMGFYPVLRLLEKPGKAQREKALSLLDMLGIGDCAVKRMDTLSGGQQQLAMLARTLTRDTPLMVLDEPDSALDFQHRQSMMRLLRERTEQLHCTVLMSSHDVNSMLQHADRLLMMKDGSVTADILLDETEPGELQSALASVYGPVALIPHKGRCLMSEV